MNLIACTSNVYVTRPFRSLRGFERNGLITAIRAKSLVHKMVSVMGSYNNIQSLAYIVPTKQQVLDRF